MKPGERIDDQEFPSVTREQLRAYAESSGDPNPIHLDEDAARSAGLPGIIAHGMLIAGLIAERGRRVQAELGPGWRFSCFRTRFKAMTFVGEVILVGGQVKSALEDEITLDLEAKNLRGEVKTQATLQLIRVR